MDFFIVASKQVVSLVHYYYKNCYSEKQIETKEKKTYNKYVFT